MRAWTGEFGRPQVAFAHTTRGLEDVGYHRTWEHGLNVDVVVSGVLDLEVQALGEREHRVLLMVYGACSGTTATPPIDDRFHTHAGAPASIILGTKALIP